MNKYLVGFVVGLLTYDYLKVRLRSFKKKPAAKQIPVQYKPTAYKIGVKSGKNR